MTRIVKWLRKIGLLALLPAFAIYATEGTDNDHAIAVACLNEAVKSIPEDGYIHRDTFLRERTIKVHAAKKAKKVLRRRVKAARRRNRSRS